MMNSVKAPTPILALILFVFTFGQALAADKVVVIPLGSDSAAPQIVVYDGGEQHEEIDTSYNTVRTVAIEASGAGVLLVNASGASNSYDEGLGRCSIVINSSDMAWDALIIFDHAAGNTYMPFAGTRGFSIANAGTVNINLVCSKYSGTVHIDDTQLTATFTPSA